MEGDDYPYSRNNNSEKKKDNTERRRLWRLWRLRWVLWWWRRKEETAAQEEAQQEEKQTEASRERRVKASKLLKRTFHCETFLKHFIEIASKNKNVDNCERVARHIHEDVTLLMIINTFTPKIVCTWSVSSSNIELNISMFKQHSSTLIQQHRFSKASYFISKKQNFHVLRE